MASLGRTGETSLFSYVNVLVNVNVRFDRSIHRFNWIIRDRNESESNAQDYSCEHDIAFSKELRWC